VCVSLNANELLLPAEGVELQQLVSFYLTKTCTEHFKCSFTFKLESDKDEETCRML